MYYNTNLTEGGWGDAVQTSQFFFSKHCSKIYRVGTVIAHGDYYRSVLILTRPRPLFESVTKKKSTKKKPQFPARFTSPRFRFTGKKKKKNR